MKATTLLGYVAQELGLTLSDVTLETETLDQQQLTLGSLCLIHCVGEALIVIEECQHIHRHNDIGVRYPHFVIDKLTYDALLNNRYQWYAYRSQKTLYPIRCRSGRCLFNSLPIKLTRRNRHWIERHYLYELPN